ncbi:MAG: hypothetical protein ACTSPY_07805 [Candidatus Helarchaeota archaeon]
MSNLSIDELMLELSFDGLRHDKNTIEFYSPDGITSTILKLNEDFKIFILETKISHNFNQLEGSVYTFAQDLYNQYSEDIVRDIIEDIAIQIKYILFPEIFNKIESFELKDTMDHESTFFYQIDYHDKEYNKIREEIYKALDMSFKMILDIQDQISIFIEKSIKKYIENPEIEIKVLEIKKKLFKVQFYNSMSGRFAGEQRRKAKRVYKEALDLYHKFKLENIEEFNKRKDFLDFLFEKYKI